jgi:hypothetical protein
MGGRVGRPVGRRGPLVSLEGFEEAAWPKSTQSMSVRPGFLPVMCWCEAYCFFVPERWVWEGKTASCGGPECEP